MTDQLTTIWVPAGIVFAFQIQMVRWRIDRETAMEKEGEVTWLPICDYLNLASMIATVMFVYVFPIITSGTTYSVSIAKHGFVLSAILLIGYLISLVGHYRLFLGGRGPRPRLPRQELVAVSVTVICAMAYFAYAWQAVESVMASSR